MAEHSNGLELGNIISEVRNITDKKNQVRLIEKLMDFEKNEYYYSYQNEISSILEDCLEDS